MSEDKITEWFKKKAEKEIEKKRKELEKEKEQPLNQEEEEEKASAWIYGQTGKQLSELVEKKRKEEMEERSQEIREEEVEQEKNRKETLRGLLATQIEDTLAEMKEEQTASLQRSEDKIRKYLEKAKEEIEQIRKRPMTCGTCGNSFSKSEMLITEKDGRPYYSCSFCYRKEGVPQEEYLSKLIPCSKCGMMVPRRQTFVLTDPDGTRNLICQTCREGKKGEPK